jgi:hypothetical protein
MQNQKFKNYFLYYLKENLLIFDVSRYIDDMALHVIDFVYDWDLLKDDLVNCSQKLIKELIEIKIKTDIDNLLQISLDNNCSILSFLFLKKEIKEWEKYFSDHIKFIKICKTTCKKHLPNFKEIKSNKKYFIKNKGIFHGIPCLIPSGDDEEFLTINIDKLKMTNKYL